MGHARFVFNMAAAQPWFVVDAVASNGDGLVDVPSPAICWRLLSPNNRQLGRSADVYDGVSSAVRAVQSFLDVLGDVEPFVTRHTGPVRWTWRVLEGNHVVAMSGRFFEAERQALRTLDNFLARAVYASVVPELVGPPAIRSDPCPEAGPLIDRKLLL